MKLKLPSMEGAVITIKSDQAEARRCYENSLKQKRSVCHVTTTPPPGVREERSVVRETQGAQRMENTTVGGLPGSSGGRRRGRRNRSSQVRGGRDGGHRQ